MAISYADAQADYVAQVTKELDALDVGVFDTVKNVDWGAQRSVEIDRILRDGVDHVIVFVSGDYVKNPAYTDVRTIAVGLAAARDRFVLPVAVDNTLLPGIPADIEPYRLSDGQLPPAKEFAGVVLAVLQRARREPAAAPHPLDFGWDEFNPDKLHCVVIGSQASAEHKPADRLADIVSRVFTGRFAKNLWHHAVTLIMSQPPLAGPRLLPVDYSYQYVVQRSVPVTSAFSSTAALERTVRLIVEADIALFDVTGFEPGVMLLLGVRGATRRGLTAVSHGTWREGEFLLRPFNLSDLALGSHAPRRDLAGSDPRVERLAARLTTGLEQMHRHPRYHDLPVYDALRELGSPTKAWEPIPLEHEVLVLCSYSEAYFGTWEILNGELTAALSRRDVIVDNIARLQDLATTQLVSQFLYEKIRRCVACVVDWTHSSPSTFFELGARLVTSPWGTAQILDTVWLDTADEVTAQQLREMRDVLDILGYTTLDQDLGDRLADRLMEVNSSRAQSGHRIRKVAADALRAVQPRLAGLEAELCEQADRLDNPERERLNVPQSLYYEVSEIKRDDETSALEKRIAAWLYLDQRIDARDLPLDDPRRKLWVSIGQQVAERLLYAPEGVELGLAIQEKVMNDR